jgi:hypothetical protein
LNNPNDITRWSDRLCQTLREIADEVVREREIFALCRELIERGVRPGMDLSISLEEDVVVVRQGGREVARERLEDDREDWLFEDGPWVARLEELSESFSIALPMAA